MKHVAGYALKSFGFFLAPIFIGLLVATWKGWDALSRNPRLLAGWGALLVFFFVLPLFLARAGRAAMKNVMYDLLTERQRQELFVDNLRMLAVSSGGRMFLAGGEEDLTPLAAQVNSEVRKQYILGFSPSGRGELKYRIVFVSVTKKGNWVVRTRRGYRGTAPDSSASVDIQRKEGS